MYFKSEQDHLIDTPQHYIYIMLILGLFSMILLDAYVLLDLLLEYHILLDLVHGHLVLANIATIEGLLFHCDSVNSLFIPLEIALMTSFESCHSFSGWGAHMKGLLKSHSTR